MVTADSSKRLEDVRKKMWDKNETKMSLTKTRLKHFSPNVQTTSKSVNSLSYMANRQY